MATGGWRPVGTEEAIEYNEELYKAVLPLFVNNIPAVQLTDVPKISNELNREQMQNIQKTYDTKGNTTAARELLGFLLMRPNWFQTFMEALDTDDLKLQEIKKLFLDKKAEVDKKWMERHGHRPEPLASVCNPSTSSQLRAPTQVHMDTDTVTAGVSVPVSAPVPASSGSCLVNDFNPLVQSSSGLERDTALENMDQEMAQDPSEPAPGASSGAAAQESEAGEEETATQPSEASGGDEQYTDATSAEGIYDHPQRTWEDAEYTRLTDV